ncbi:hypothetical protein SAMN06265182_0377 [Persephonella hydrogeniphila]|uniref:Uncharacterized protein n=1 Tax=Persephonella hydrogeniphila TaxID=198703 RepID=A0A285N603_9AQUI|nr:hypothetical protein [Persephonella hydrogeniphila]SNZ03426.1 hypothetical protein SAMN06265182_0377 [Persephonella hydrogeniphila]
MITKILWEAFSVLLLLYGSYLIYVFLWFTAVRVWNVDIGVAKLISGLLVGIILVYSSIKWFKKKKEELKEREETA